MKKIKDRKDDFIFILLSESDKQKIQAEASVQRLSMSSFCLNSVLNALKTQKLDERKHERTID